MGASERYETELEGLRLVIDERRDHIQAFVYDPENCEVLYTAAHFNLNTAKFASVEFAATARFGPRHELKIKHFGGNARVGAGWVSTRPKGWWSTGERLSAIPNAFTGHPLATATALHYEEHEGKRNVTFPEIGLIAGTRVALGIGIELLLFDRLNKDQLRDGHCLALASSPQSRFD